VGQIILMRIISGLTIPSLGDMCHRVVLSLPWGIIRPHLGPYNPFIWNAQISGLVVLLLGMPLCLGLLCLPFCDCVPGPRGLVRTTSWPSLPIWSRCPASLMPYCTIIILAFSIKCAYSKIVKACKTQCSLHCTILIMYAV